MTSPWYRCFPRDYNDGMDGLTLEERGAYATILNLIYERGGPLPEESWRITSKLGCSGRVWVRVRAALIVKGKLYQVEIDGKPHLMNERAGREITEREEFSKNRAEAGSRGGRNSRAKLNKINARPEAELKPSLSTDQAIHIHSHRLSVVPSNEETTGGQPPDDLDGKAWAEAVGLLVGQGGMKPEAARAFFGKLLSEHKLQARDLLGAINEAFANRTPDPRSWLVGAAKSRGRGRQTGPPKRVGFV